MDTKTTLQRIANTLVINIQYLDNEGLSEGKTGVALFFYHCARYCKNERYTAFADNLLDEIIESLHTSMSFDFNYSLGGIAWSIDYLIRTGFVEGDPDEVFEEIDDRFLEVLQFIKEQKEKSEKNFSGYIYYYLLRTAEGRNNSISRQATSVLQQLSDSLGKTPELDTEKLSLSFLLSGLKNISKPDMLRLINERIDNLTKNDLFLEDGLPAYGLKLMLNI